MRPELHRLFDPRSVAVVGASPDASGRGGRITSYLVRYFDGTVYPVNPSHAEVLGLPCYPSLADLPAPADLVIVCLRADAAIDVVEGIEPGTVGAVMVIAAGFAEAATATGAARHQRLRAAAQRAGVRILGPNTAGFRVIRSASSGLLATHAADPERDIFPGGVAIIAQSGGMGIYLGPTVLRARGAGLRYLIDVGNEADLDVADCLDYVLTDPEATAIGLIIEGAGDGRRISHQVRQARDAGRAVTVLKLGRDAAGVEQIRTHTGALAGRADVFESELRQAGAVLVADEGEFADCLALQSRGLVPRGNGVGLAATSGGMCVLGSDLAGRHRLVLPPAVRQPAESLVSALPFSRVANPLDLAGYMSVGPAALGAALEYLGSEAAIDAVILCQGDIGDGEVVAIAAAQAKLDVPVFTVGRIGAAGQVRLDSAGVGQFESAGQLFRVLGRLVGQPAARPVTEQAANGQGRVLGLRELGAELADHGLPVSTARPVATAQDALAVLAGGGTRIYLKAATTATAHKTEAGLVAGPLVADEVAAAFDRLAAACQRLGDPGAEITAEPEVTGVELAFGGYRDPSFGPVVMVAMGGIYAELLEDAAFAAAPVSTDRASAMISGLRGYPLLLGPRGQQPSDTAAAACLLSSFSAYFADASRDYQAMDLNPVIVGPRGAGAVIVDLAAVPAPIAAQGGQA
jgi:acetate---CoA ligase (ADP-forming)